MHTHMHPVYRPDRRNEIIDEEQSDDSVLEAVELLVTARKQTILLRSILYDLHHSLPDMHENWQGFIGDTDAFERCFSGTLREIGELIQQDPSQHTYPRRKEG